MSANPETPESAPERVPEPNPTRTVRTTMRPDEAIDVDDTEYADLQQQGLLADNDDEPTLTEKTLATERAHGNVPPRASEKETE